MAKGSLRCITIQVIVAGFQFYSVKIRRRSPSNAVLFNRLQPKAVLQIVCIKLTDCGRSFLTFFERYYTVFVEFEQRSTRWSNDKTAH